MNSDNNYKVESVLNKLHKDASHDFHRMSKGAVKSMFRPMQPIDFENLYLPISREQGQTLKKLIINKNCKQVVEFGTSFGISTIYLADAVRQTGGKVITTELLESKAKRAQQNIREAGLDDYVDIWLGDAMQTLRGYSEKIDFLFLDGWKDLYLPLFKMLEPQFHSGTLIYADNMDMEGTRPYADFILEKENSYSTQSVDHGKAFLTYI